MQLLTLLTGSAKPKGRSGNGRSPDSVPHSDLTVAPNLRAWWNKAKVRSGEAIIRRALACAWVGLFSFMVAHWTVYWCLRQKLSMFLQELTILILLALMMIPLAIFLPSRVYMQRCRRKIGVSTFTSKWSTYLETVIGRPLATSLIWVLGFSLIAIVWQGVEGLIFIHRLSWPKDWLFAMLCAIPIAIAESFPVSRLASRDISRRVGSLESTT